MSVNTVSRYSCDVMCDQSPVEAGRGGGTVWRRRDDGAGVCGLESGHRQGIAQWASSPRTLDSVVSQQQSGDVNNCIQQLWIAIIVIGLACYGIFMVLVFSCLLKPIYIP